MTLRRFNSRETLDADDEIAGSGPVAINGHANSHQEQSDTEEEFGINLPHSTHSLLFTEPVLSLPFWFAASTASLSFFVMILALINNRSGSTENNVYSVPVNVSPAVRASQYCDCIVKMRLFYYNSGPALLMEEEIPTGIYLLRRIPKLSLKTAHINYKKFVASSIVRIIIGYTFLVNAFLVIVQGDRVLDIFYDMLALGFVEQLDDFSFQLATIDVFGKRMKRATTKKCFRAEFPHQSIGRGKGLSIFLKTLYFFNLLVFLSLLSVVSLQQKRGFFNCKSITVTFGNDIWEEAVVKTTNGYSEAMLVYSFFNGVYEQKGSQDGRPVYIEQNKFDNTPYIDKVGAEIKYCGKLQAWVFTHENIKKSTSDESECPWLLKAHSLGYDLLDVPSDSWSVWVGTISQTEVSIACNTCNENVDCNLNGECLNGVCECDTSDNSVHLFGLHCEHKLKEQCTALKDNDNQTWSVAPLPDKSLFTAYGRPLYGWYGSSSNKFNLTGNDSLYMVYSGSRYLGIVFKETRFQDVNFWQSTASDYHPFWSVELNKTVFVSAPTTETTPVGVDFFEMGEQGEQYGPFGVLYPMQYPPGRGYFYCVGP
ncbi:hypothetical protein HJC23_010975 [Cyclotella cryptica]|uniref:Farnesoic acid O-methyl transferase domain-containing protein n=1 Tax=Cyclotella cryptica TaxID=29204 RepID=A0ABD3PYL3_9STRA